MTDEQFDDVVPEKSYRMQRTNIFDDSDEGFDRFSPEVSVDEDDDDIVDDESMFAYGPNHAVHNKSKFKTRLVTFYRNGDKHFKGLTIPVNYKNYSTWETLLMYLGDKISLPYGVRHVYTLNGDPIHDIGELDDGRGYVCASGQFISRISYGRVKNSEKHWNNRKPSAGPLRKTDKLLFKRDHDKQQQEAAAASQYYSNGPTTDMQQRSWAKPRAIIVVSNTNRDSRAKILLNPRTSQSFEHVLRDMSQAVMLHNPPVKQLYTWKTEEKVHSFSQLFHEFQDHDVFIACGLEPLRRVQIPSDSSLEESDTDRDNGYTNGHDNGMPPPHQGPKYNQSHQSLQRKRPAKKLKRSDPEETYEAYQRQRRSYEESPRDSSSEDTLPPIKPKHAFTRSTEDVSTRSRHPHRQMLRRSTFKISTSQAEFPVLPKEFQTQPDEVPMEETDDNNHTPREKKEAKPSRVTQLLNVPSPEHVQSDSDLPSDFGYFQEKYAKRFKHLAPKTYYSPARLSIHGQMREFYPTDDVMTGHANPSAAPKKKLKLDWVYGYRGFDCGNNLFVLSSSELAYYVGAVVVLYDRKAHTQRHYVGHNEDIQCMALHPSGTYIATGQKEGYLPDSTAHVRVWQVSSLCTHAIIGLDCFQVGISALSFSNENEGKWLLIVDNSKNHILSVWDWNEDLLLAQNEEYELLIDPTHEIQQSQNDMVVVADFHPQIDSLIVSAGKQHLYFWTLDNNRIVRDRRSGIFEGDNPKYITCLAFSQVGEVIVGDATGTITIWGKDSETEVFCIRHKIQHAHERSVYSLCMLEDGTLLSGGGLDRRLLAWDSMRDYASVKVERLFPESAGGIRAIAPVNMGGADGVVVLGTTKNSIMIGSLRTKFNYILQGHSEELWALETHPTDSFFVTAGYDCFVMLWSAENNKLVWKVNVEKPCLSCCFDPTGAIIAVGTTVGRFVILHAANGMHVTSVQIGSDKLDAIRFSPDGSMLVMGSHDHKIYIFAVMDDGQVYRKVIALQGHGNFLTHIDWSVDNMFLRSVSGNYDLLYWDLQEMKQEGNKQKIRGIKWETNNCILGYNVMGIWPSRDRGTDINTVGRSNNHQILVAGDNYGFLSLFRYPCTSFKAESHESKHHSSHVTGTKFLFNDQVVISSGGVDAVLLQWRLVDKKGRAHYDSI
ncbi:echinoderm microtubule-associated protein-like 2 isoform X2 [Antedon mediterranea]|uniref:echinoderm microtubule-associated protein-like 2 isoform X2 n=1 Tax=Antedon mediterranea TaxID=105859 RepID=UPI003AF68057